MRERILLLCSKPGCYCHGTIWPGDSAGFKGVSKATHPVLTLSAQTTNAGLMGKWYG
jgi:hypothetical protein